MRKLSDILGSIKVAGSKASYSLANLSIPVESEVRAFLLDCYIYLQNFNLSASILAQIYAILCFAFWYDNNPFHYSYTNDGFIVTELYDSFSGDSIYIMLQQDFSQNTFVFSIEIEHQPIRDLGC